MIFWAAMMLVAVGAVLRHLNRGDDRAATKFIVAAVIFFILFAWAQHQAERKAEIEHSAQHDAVRSRWNPSETSNSALMGTAPRLTPAALTIFMRFIRALARYYSPVLSYGYRWRHSYRHCRMRKLSSRYSSSPASCSNSAARVSGERSEAIISHRPFTSAEAPRDFCSSRRYASRLRSCSQQ